MRLLCFSFFFFNDTATTEIYTLSLHDALPIYFQYLRAENAIARRAGGAGVHRTGPRRKVPHCFRRWITNPVVLLCRSEEHTSELQSQSNLVCRLLLEKKKKT